VRISRAKNIFIIFINHTLKKGRLEGLPIRAGRNCVCALRYFGHFNAKINANPSIQKIWKKTKFSTKNIRISSETGKKSKFSTTAAPVGTAEKCGLWMNFHGCLEKSNAENIFYVIFELFIDFSRKNRFLMAFENLRLRLALFALILGTCVSFRWKTQKKILHLRLASFVFSKIICAQPRCPSNPSSSISILQKAEQQKLCTAAYYKVP
jgi:hypothetical protein